LNRKRLAVFTVAALVASMTTGLTAGAGAAGNGSITGAGSTLMAPLMAHWQQDFESKYGIHVDYGAVGSGAGISQITARSVDFGASDAPLKPSQAQACNNCLQIPWALTGVAIAYHLDGVPKLRLSGPVLANIYLGNITNWSSPSIKRLNPGVNLPDLKITPVFRSDGSGDTYAFTNYLWKVSGPWKSKVGIYATSVNFPSGVGGKGNDGITAVVSSTNGSNGYVSASYAIAHGLNAAAIKNAAGAYEYPNLRNIQAAASYITKVPANNEVHIVNPPARIKNAYPISTFSYIIVPSTTPKKGLLSKFIFYALGAGQKFGAALDFAPIPKVVHTAGINTARKFQQG
jgi:phosphate transport system substrate-binding protein